MGHLSIDIRLTRVHSQGRLGDALPQTDDSVALYRYMLDSSSSNVAPLIRYWVIFALVTGFVAASIAVACAGVGQHTRRPSPEPGMVRATLDGVEVFVPQDWPRNALECGTPVRDTVVIKPGPAPACLLRNPPVVSYVWLKHPERPGVDPDETLAKNHVNLDGHDARRSQDQLSDGRTRVVLVVPDRGVVVVAVSTDPGLAQRIVDSAHLV